MNNHQEEDFEDSPDQFKADFTRALVIKGQGHYEDGAVRQYIMPTCYGSGLRLRDISVPRMPQCLLDKKESMSNTSVNEMIGTTKAKSVGSLLKWSVMPPNVVQLEGLPLDFDASLWQDLVGHYGAVMKSEVQRTNQEAFIRFKLDSRDACEQLATNIDGSEIYGDKIRCIHLSS